MSFTRDQRQAQLLIERGVIDRSAAQRLWPLLSPQYDFCGLCLHYQLISVELANELRTLVAQGASAYGVFDHPQYQLLRELGRGGMGCVYLARARSTGAQFVMKLLLNKDANLELRERFQREAEALSSLSHPNVVGVREFGEHNGQPFLVMDFIDGQTLDQVIQESLSDTGQVPDESVVVDHFVGLASALAALHEVGLSHRDVKPSNILIEKGSDRVVLVDLGLAKKQSQDAASLESLTKSGQMLGSPGFMAPEQLSAKEGVAMGPWTDVWGLGATLFYCLTGALPVEGVTFLEVAAALSAGRVREVREVNSQCPQWLNDLCGSCLQREVSLRPSSDELRRALQGREWQSQGGRSWLWVVVVAVILVLGLGLGSWLLADREPPRLSLKETRRLIRTRSFEYVLEGRVEDANPDAVMINEQRFKLASDGAFRRRFRLTQGTRRLVIKAVDAGGLESAPVILDIDTSREPPRVELESFEPVDGGQWLLRGRVSKERCRARYLNRSLKLSKNLLSLKVSLKDLLSSTSVSLTDDYGNSADWAMPVVLVRAQGKSLPNLIEEAPSGSLFLLSPGVYKLNCDLKKNLSFVGLAERTEVVLEGERVFRSFSERVRFQRLTLRTRSYQEVGAVVRAGRVEFLSCDLKLEGRFGLKVLSEGAERAVSCVMRDCRVYVRGNTGVHLEGARGQFESTSFLGGYLNLSKTFSDPNAVTGLVRSELSFRRTLFSKIQGSCVRVGLSRAEFRLCDFREAADRGIQCQASDVEVLACYFERISRCAIEARFPSQLRVIGCDFIRSGLPQSASLSTVVMRSGAVGELGLCRLTKGGFFGVYKGGESWVRLWDCAFRGNRFGPWGVDYERGLRIERCESPSQRPESKPVSSRSIEDVFDRLNYSDDGIQGGAYEELRWRREEVLPELDKRSLFMKENSTGLFQVRLLGHFGAASRSFFEKLYKGLTYEDPVMRRTVAWALGHIGLTPGQQRELRARLQAAASSDKALWILSVFESLPPNEVDEAILKTYLSHKDGRFREQALRALWHQSLRRSGLEIMKAALEDPDGQVRRAVVSCLSEEISESAGRLLLSSLKPSLKLEERLHILNSLRADTEAVRARLWREFLSGAESRARCVALLRLMEHGPKAWRLVFRGAPEAFRVLGRGSEELRVLLLVLGSLGPRAQLLESEIEAICRDAEDESLSLSAAWALCRIREGHGRAWSLPREFKPVREAEKSLSQLWLQRAQRSFWKRQ